MATLGGLGVTISYCSEGIQVPSREQLIGGDGMNLKFIVGDSKYKMGEIEIRADVVTQLGPNKWKIMKGNLDLTLEYKTATFDYPSKRTISYVCLY